MTPRSAGGGRALRRAQRVRPLARLLIAAAAVLSPFAVACAQEGAARPAFEGVFTQTEEQIQSGGAAAGAATIHQITKITGSLVWSPEQPSEQDLPHLPSFGDAASTFYVPMDGEIRVEFAYDGRSVMGACHFTGSRTLPIRQLPPNALNYMVLEVAEDGRYELALGMMAGMLPVPIRNRGCRAMLILPLDVGDVWRDASIEIGYRHGVVSDDKIEGAMSPPLVAGPSTTTGTWSFVRVGARND